MSFRQHRHFPPIKTSMRVLMIGCARYSAQ